MLIGAGPAACAGIEAVIIVGESTATPCAGVSPAKSQQPLRKFAPVARTTVPPPWLPNAGLTDASDGTGPANVKPLCRRASPSPQTTVTSTGPGSCGAVTADIVTPLTSACDATGRSPRRTTQLLLKLMPLTCSVVPPAAGPLAGVTAVMYGPTGRSVISTGTTTSNAP